MESRFGKFFGLFLVIVCLYGCAGNILNGNPSPAAIANVCPPRPTLTPDKRPTETPILHREFPTAAPPPTKGPYPTEFYTPAPTLAAPLDTQERVVAFLYAEELRRGMQWKDPWCPEMLQFAPSRVQAKRFDSVEEAESTMGASTSSREIEPAWVVTVRGTIDLIPPGGPMTAKYWRQVIGEKTGNFYLTSFGGQDPPPTLGAPQAAEPTKIRVRKTRKPNGTPTP